MNTDTLRRAAEHLDWLSTAIMSDEAATLASIAAVPRLHGTARNAGPRSKNPMSYAFKKAPKFPPTQLEPGHGLMPQRDLSNGRNWAVQQRLRFMDFLLAEYGTLNRSALVDYYGISQPQAANDIASYREIAPGNLEYDLSAKTYRRTAQFKRVWP